MTTISAGMGARPSTPLGSDRDWVRLYAAGALAAVVYVVLVLVPIVLVFTTAVPPTTGGALLEYLAEHRAVYLIQLVCFVGLAVPGLVVFASVAFALRSADVGLATLGGLLGVVSETIALALGSSPQSLHGGLVVLANRYSQTESAAERASLASSADTLIAATNAVSWAGVLTAAAILLLSALTPAAGWGRAIAALGVITGALGIVAEALRPMIGAAYAIYGLLLPVWFGLVGWQLLRRTRRPTALAPGS